MHLTCGHHRLQDASQRPPPLKVSALRTLHLPDWVLHVAQGANHAFHSREHIVHASSPARAERELRLCLQTGKLLAESGGGTPEEQAYQEELRVERVPVRALLGLKSPCAVGTVADVLLTRCCCSVARLAASCAAVASVMQASSKRAARLHA